MSIFKGTKYNRALDVLEIKRLVNAELKELYPKSTGYKFGLNIKRCSGGCNLTITIKATPFNMLNENYNPEITGDLDNTILNVAGTNLRKDLHDIMNQYNKWDTNRNYSHNFYDEVYIDSKIRDLWEKEIEDKKVRENEQADRVLDINEVASKLRFGLKERYAPSGYKFSVTPHVEPHSRRKSIVVNLTQSSHNGLNMGYCRKFFASESVDGLNKKDKGLITLLSKVSDEIESFNTFSESFTHNVGIGTKLNDKWVKEAAEEYKQEKEEKLEYEQTEISQMNDFLTNLMTENGLDIEEINDIKNQIEGFIDSEPVHKLQVFVDFKSA
jgi:hypothetical protein